MKELFGGGTQEGIIPSETTPNILIYVDHESGKKYGYEDGWLEEEDDLGPVFEYTGQGTQGEQTFLGQRGSRNAAVLYHADAGRALRVFMTTGKVPGSKSAAKQQRYIGEFKLDSKQPYTLREANDEKGKRRRIIVFRLRPTGDYERRDQDVITRAETTEAYPVLAAVAESRLPEPKMVEPRRKRASESRRAAQPSLIADLRQSHLRDQYLKNLTEQEHKVFAYQIKIAGTTTILKTDLYDATEHELYSVRGESSREEVRTAIGQLKDYVRHIKPCNPKLSVLLPERPHDDLLNLLHTEGIDVVHRDGTGYVRCSAK
jgi:5-methylcytosine-specific restriction protein A